jgi:hypothetical protein
MRFPALAVLALVTSGCTIHVVEQPATAAMLAEAPPPARARPVQPRARHDAYPPTATAANPVPIATPTPVTTPAPIAGPTPAPTSNPITAPPHRNRPHVTTPTRRPFRIPFKTLPPETRSPQLAAAARKPRRPQKVEQDEPVRLLSSTGVAKAQ